ncbi:MAG: MFS transporter [Thaumarchaeota archaeon]|nr:MFS transporter [Nitrososphaerota archaeon]
MSIFPTRMVFSLSVAVASVMLGFGLFGPFLPLYAELLGATLGLQVGFMTSAFTMSRAALSIPLGGLSDRMGRKKMIVVGLFTYGIATFAYALASDWVHLVGLRAVQGISAGMLWPSATALIADEVPPGSRGKALGTFNAAATAGLLGGPALGGALQLFARNTLQFDIVDSFRVPFYAGGLLGILSAVLALKLIAEHPMKLPIQPNGISISNVAPKFKATFYSLLGLSFAHGFSLSFIGPIVVFYVQHQFNLSVDITTSTMAIAFFFSGLANTISQFFMGRVADKWGRKRLLLFGALSSQLATIAIAFSPTVLIVIVMMTARAALSASYVPALSSLQEDIMPRSARGKLTGVMDTAGNIGSVLGPIVGFALYDYIGTNTPFFATAVIFFVAIIVFQIMGREPRIEESEV